jgi:hypothetical protein
MENDKLYNVVKKLLINDGHQPNIVLESLVENGLSLDQATALINKVQTDCKDTILANKERENAKGCVKEIALLVYPIIMILFLTDLSEFDRIICTILAAVSAYFVKPKKPLAAILSGIFGVMFYSYLIEEHLKDKDSFLLVELFLISWGTLIPMFILFHILSFIFHRNSK